MAADLNPILDAQGVTGDFYCDISTDDVYRKTPEGWVFLRNIPGVSSLISLSAKGLKNLTTNPYQLSFINMYSLKSDEQTST